MNTKILADFKICNIAALKLMKLLVYKIITKQTALKNHPTQSPKKMFCFINVLFSFTDITMEHQINEKCKIRLENVIRIPFLHIEKHNENHIEVDIESPSK